MAGGGKKIWRIRRGKLAPPGWGNALTGGPDYSSLAGRVGLPEAEMAALKAASKTGNAFKSAVAATLTAPRKKQDRAEQRFQINAVVPYLLAVLDPRETFWFHVPNGGARSPVEAKIMKAMGVKAGMPDIVVWALRGVDVRSVEMRGVYKICLIELKRPDGKGGLSKAQQDRYAELANLALVPFLCESLDDVKLALEGDGIPLRPHTLYPTTGAYVVHR